MDNGKIERLEEIEKSIEQGLETLIEAIQIGGIIFDYILNIM